MKFMGSTPSGTAAPISSEGAHAARLGAVDAAFTKV
jgi:hypothetical protein